MPLTEMEPGIVEERDKISNRKKKAESESRGMQKITDHFKTPEKDLHVVSKQKSLLQFFSKSPAPVLNKTDVTEKVFEEKENKISCNNLVFPQWSAKVTDKSNQQTCKEELDFGSNKSIKNQEKNSESLDQSDSVILLSDLSSDNINQSENQSRTDDGGKEQVGNTEVQKQKTRDKEYSGESTCKDVRITCDSETEDENKAKTKENDKSETLEETATKGKGRGIEAGEDVRPSPEPVQASTGVSENNVAAEQVEQTQGASDSIKNKDSSVKHVKKNTLKGSEMMHLLKEIKNSEKHEKKKKHKHKEKLKSKEETHTKTEEKSDEVKHLNEKTEIINEKVPNVAASVDKNVPTGTNESSDREPKKKKGRLRKNGLVEAKVSQDKDSVAGISYEEFLENIEDKPEPTKTAVEMSYTEYLQSLESQAEDDTKTDSDKQSGEFTKLMDSEDIKLHEDKEEIIKVKDGKIKCEPFVNKGIANFFSKTSTPAKPKEKTSKTESVNSKKGKSGLTKVKSTGKSKLKSNENDLRDQVNKVNMKKEDVTEEPKVDDGLVVVKEKFMKGSDKTVFPDKTKQATLSFGSAGLSMSKQTIDKKVSHVDDKPVVIQRKRGRPKKKQVEETKSEIQTISLDATSDSVFETPGRGRKRKKEDSSDFDKSAVSLDSTQETRRSTRKKYKVTAFQMDTNHKTPIKLKLKRCGKSSSSGDDELKAMQQVKIKLSKAQALLEKARKRQQKYKTKLKKADVSEKHGDKKNTPKQATEANGKLEKLDKDTDTTRRSSRLVGKSLPSMEEVSLDNIVISSDDEEGSGAQTVKKKGRPKGSAKALSLPKKEMNDGTTKVDLTTKKESLKNTPKKSKTKSDTPKKISTPKKTLSATPKKSTGTPKKGKLAPLFLMGKAKTQPASPAKPVLDPEQAKQRQQFLMSGVPEELRKQTASRIAAIVEADYPPLPKHNHVQQIPLDTVSDRSWTLSNVELKVRPYSCTDPVLPISTFNSVITRGSMQVDLDYFKKFSGHARMEEGIMEECLNEVASYNPSYPVNKVYQSLLHNKPAELTESVPDPVVVIDEETVPKKRGRRSLKLQKKAEDQEKKEPVPVPKKAAESGSGSCQSLWTEKYCPVKSSEVLGNSTILKKLKNWLSEWKQLLDKEARKARKLLMKKNKGKIVSKAADADDMWDDDSDFDLDSEDSEDDTSLCNTMLLVGPNGCGKTCSVYALAQELGYKVHEVNASASRNGRHILSQLQEATQSHQVASSHGCNTPTKKPVSGELEKPPNAKMSTSFANFFNKKTDTKSEVNKKEKKRKRNKSDKDECPDKKRRKKEEDVKKLDNTTQGFTQAINLTSTTMILFDEVDVFFEEDKGFLSAIQTFMSTTKIPIILTTSDPGFTSMFDGRYEQLTLRRPPVRSIVSRLQIIALLENLRIDVDKLSELVVLYNKDVRKCLVSLQYMLESGGSGIQTYRQVQRPGITTTPLPVITEDSQDCSQESFTGSHTLKTTETGGKEFDDDDDDFITVKPLATRRKRILEDDSSASVDAFSQMFVQKSGSTGLASSENDAEARKYPPVHVVGVETCLGISGENKLTTLDSLVKFLKGECTNPSYMAEVCGVFRQSLHSSIIYSNLPVLLPMAVKVVDSVAKATLDKPCKHVPPKRKRIQEDLYDSEASIDASDIFNPAASDTDTPIEDNTGDNDSDTKTGNREENLCLSRTLSSIASMYDTMSSLDVLETGSNTSVIGRLQGRSGRELRGRLVSGMETSLPKHHVNTCVDEADVLELGVEIETRAACRLYKDIDTIQTQVEQLCANNPAFSEEFVLPVLKGSETFRLSNTDGFIRTAEVSRACDNIQDCIPLVAHKHHRNLHMDYMPTLREICRFEQCRQITNTKRRFQHYFDSVNFSVKDRTLGVLSTTFM